MTDLSAPLGLARDLIQRRSITPQDDGCLEVLKRALTELGFTCHDLPFGEVRNLYARRGSASPHFCFAGHTDVVPPGQGWSVDPFEAQLVDGVLFGRGAVDMKSAIACFVAAVARLGDGHPGSISLLITGDEEGVATHGTVKVLDWMNAKGETPDCCLVGEPTNPKSIGDAVKVGRRGSLNGRLTVNGIQGHAAYPHLADNPLPRLLRILTALTANPLDQGSAQFEPSTFTLTTIDTGNAATNVIPAQAKAGFNIRFNDLHSSASLDAWLRKTIAEAGGDADWKLDIEVSGESFLTPQGPFVDAVCDAIKDVTGKNPERSTSGGTSDARFITRHCPVIEFGLGGATMHKSDERVPLDDLESLTLIYRRVLERVLAS
ncbi:MAG: succinyl-diaminopimelate desuccinylase [Alphaproteobacteria bacterium]|nr:succinyl-diaminopimelate desuccinylase [Alphaproteobacteria bacterium]